MAPLLELDLKTIEDTFKAFISSSKADHFILYVPTWVPGLPSGRGPFLSPVLTVFLDGCFHRRFMKVVNNEGFKVVNIFFSYDYRSRVCFLLSRKLSTSSEHPFTSRTFESLHAAGVFWNDTHHDVSCWDDMTSQFPNLLLCSRTDRVVRASPSAKYLEKESMPQKEYKQLKILASTLATLRALNHGSYDTANCRIYGEPIPHVHYSSSHWCDERLPFNDGRGGAGAGAGDLSQIYPLSDGYLLGGTSEETVTTLPYGFLKVTDEDINDDHKPGRHKEDNAARKEKKRQYRKSLKARKKAAARDSFKESIEQQNSESDTLLHDPFSGSATEPVMTLPPELQKRMQSFPEGSELTSVKSNVAGWITKVILISFGFQLCVLWKGMVVIEILVAFGVGYFAAYPV